MCICFKPYLPTFKELIRYWIQRARSWKSSRNAFLRCFHECNFWRIKIVHIVRNFFVEGVTLWNNKHYTLKSVLSITRVQWNPIISTTYCSSDKLILWPVFPLRISFWSYFELKIVNFVGGETLQNNWHFTLLPLFKNKYQKSFLFITKILRNSHVH